MSKENPITSLSQYYKRFWKRFWRDISEKWWEGVIYLIVSIAVAFFQFKLGLIRREQTAASALVNVTPSLVILLFYVARHLIRTPWQLDVERQGEINNGLAAIDKLEEQVDKFSSEANRPKFKLTQPTVSGIGEFDEDERYAFSFRIENIGSRAAVNLVTRVIVMEQGDDKKPKVLEMTGANEVQINDPLTTRFEMMRQRNDPPVEVIIALRFTDAITEKVYEQAFFMKWEGMKQRAISEVVYLTSQEREELMRRLGATLEKVQTGELDQNVGSMPNSKID
jgi:hypothetical protein